ncbi:MAG: hypothetical protein QM493_07675 [Sulfurovum sp.]
MQLIIDIPSNSLGDKIIQILNVFKSDGIKIEKRIEPKKIDESLFTKEYIEENWKELVMGCKSDPDYYKSEQYYNDRGEYLMEKYR